MSVFDETAPLLAEAGLVAIPLRADSKRPLVKGFPAFRVSDYRAFQGRFNEANVGVLNGQKSRLTAVDVDDPALTDECRQRFGQTPVEIETPSGGRHLLYRHNGERRVIGFERAKVDILGSGGIEVFPPSVLERDGLAFNSKPSRCRHVGETAVEVSKARYD